LLSLSLSLSLSLPTVENGVAAAAAAIIQDRIYFKSGPNKGVGQHAPHRRENFAPSGDSAGTEYEIWRDAATCHFELGF
jgi:hypothetical protein